MPQIFNNVVMTNAGKALLSKEIAGECMIQITRMAVGSGVYTDSEKSIDALQEMTALKNEVQSTGLSALKRIDQTSVLVSGVFANDADDASNVDYHMNEIGLFAQEKGNKNTEILYSIAVVSAEEGEIMPASNGKNPVRIIQDWIVTVSNSETATIESLPDGAYAMAEDVGNVDELETTEKGTLVSAVNETLRRLIVEDTSGLLGSASAEVEAQELLDEIAGKVKNDLLSKKGDSAENTVTFTSSDSATVNAWTNVPEMESGEKHKSLFGKISTMFKNVRYLYKVLGTTDLSNMEDGTVTGVLAAVKPYCFSNPTNNLLATKPGTALDAVQGKVLKDNQNIINPLMMTQEAANLDNIDWRTFEKPYVFGFSTTLSNTGVWGYWTSIFVQRLENNFVYLRAIGSTGRTAHRAGELNNGVFAWHSDWILDATQNQIDQINSDLKKWHSDIKWFSDSGGKNYVVLQLSDDFGIPSFPRYFRIVATASYQEGDNSDKTVYVTGIYYEQGGTELKVYLNKSFVGGLYISYMFFC